MTSARVPVFLEAFGSFSGFAVFKPEFIVVHRLAITFRDAAGAARGNQSQGQDEYFIFTHCISLKIGEQIGSLLAAVQWLGPALKVGQKGLFLRGRGSLWLSTGGGKGRRRHSERGVDR